VRFYQVGEEELEDLREKFRNGQLDISIEHKTFSMAEYNEMVAGEVAAVGFVQGPAQGGGGGRGFHTLLLHRRRARLLRTVHGCSCDMHVQW
jgi:hypothetical protein